MLITIYMKIYYAISLRYCLALLAAFPNLALFYYIFTPLTVYVVYFILGLFYPADLIGRIVLINGYSIELIGACIAGAAYYLLFALNLATPMNFKKRIMALLFSFTFFLFINILRISLLSTLFINSFSNSFSFFNITHLLFWYLLSVVFVVAIWFLTAKIFNIKEIPLYTDLLSLRKDIL